MRHSEMRQAFGVQADGSLDRRQFLATAGRLGAGVLVVLPTKFQDTYRVSIEPIELPTAGLTPLDLAEDLRVFMGRVEQCILERPYLWRDLRRADLMLRLGMENPA